MRKRKAYPSARAGFTLIETLVAITILVVAVSTPLTLAAQSLFAAYYAKDQVIASHLAQEAIETVRQKRDHNLMQILDDVSGANWLKDTQLEGVAVGIEKLVKVDIEDITNTVFETTSSIDNSVLQYNGFLYIHDSSISPAKDSKFKRLVRLEKISQDEIEVTVEVKWQTGTFSPRTFTIKENLYNWLP